MSFNGSIRISSNEQLYDGTNYYAVVNPKWWAISRRLDSVEYIDENSAAVIVKIINQTRFTANILTLVDLKDDSFIKRWWKEETCCNISADLVDLIQEFAVLKINIGSIIGNQL